jgi:hypothetical protein
LLLVVAAQPTFITTNQNDQLLRHEYLLCNHNPSLHEHKEGYRINQQTEKNKHDYQLQLQQGDKYNRHLQHHLEYQYNQGDKYNRHMQHHLEYQYNQHPKHHLQADFHF